MDVESQASPIWDNGEQLARGGLVGDLVPISEGLGEKEWTWGGDCPLHKELIPSGSPSAQR